MDKKKPVEKISPKDYSLSRAELLTDGFKGLLLVNGGGAVALLAFLQAIWTVDQILAKAVLVGIGCMSLGLAIALLIPFFRYHHSHEAEKKEQGVPYSEKWKKRSLRLYVGSQYASVLCFLIGTSYLLVKGWSQL